MYPVTVDPLHTVFSPYGAVQKIAIFEKNNGWQALIQYADAVSAANAKTALEGHAIYDGGYNRVRPPSCGKHAALPQRPVYRHILACWTLQGHVVVLQS